ncbi:MAG: hypothetical protein HY273_01395 [Gammaproteobacteria bacterium]|nr:hypothetical protein [Gammaproteobacteria bacterium]
MPKSALMLVLTYAVLAALLLWQAPRYGEFWIPLYQWEISLLSPELDITKLEIGAPQGERVVMLNAEARPGSVFGRHFFERAVSMNSSTLLGHMLLHPIVMLLIVLMWPTVSITRKFFYALATAPFLVAVELLDIPLVLLGSLEDLVLSNAAPDELRFTPMVSWMNLLNGGGRIALSVVAALLAIATVQIVAPYVSAKIARQTLA